MPARRELVLNKHFEKFVFPDSLTKQGTSVWLILLETGPLFSKRYFMIGEKQHQFAFCVFNLLKATSCYSSNMRCGRASFELEQEKPDFVDDSQARKLQQLATATIRMQLTKNPQRK